MGLSLLTLLTIAAGRWFAVGEVWGLREAQSIPSPEGASGLKLTDVSCTATSACTATGTYGTEAFVGIDRETRTLAEIWNGTTWAVQTSTNVEGKKFNSLAGVPCSSSACTAVGNARPESGWADGTVTLAERWG